MAEPLKVLFGLIIATLVVTTATLTAHHSYSGTYLEDQTVRIEGTVLQFVYRNPHSFVTIEATDESGRSGRWEVEWASRLALSAQGISPDTLKVADRVVVTGSPGRKPADHRMRMRSILRIADGWRWTLR